jgi:hypothetical protein
MKNLFCRMLWEDPAKFSSKHPKDQKSIITFGLAISLVVMIEVIAAYYNASNTFLVAAPIACVVAIIWGLIIYIIDLLIIRSPNTGWVKVSRFVIGLMFALIGSFTVDSAFFKKEIDSQLRENAKTEIAKQYDIQIVNQKNEAQIRYSDWNEKQKVAVCEAEGCSRTGIIGVGAVYKAKKEAADIAQQEYIVANQKLNKLENEKKDAIDFSYTQAIKDAGFLHHIKAHFQFMFNDAYALALGLCFTSIILFIQLLVLGLKQAIGPSIEDQIIEARAGAIERDIRNKMKIDASPLGMFNGIMKPALEVLQGDNSQS